MVTPYYLSIRKGECREIRTKTDWRTLLGFLKDEEVTNLIDIEFSVKFTDKKSNLSNMIHRLDKEGTIRLGEYDQQTTITYLE